MTYKVGDKVKFLGYAFDVPEDQRVLLDGHVYDALEVDMPTETIVVKFENPDFDKDAEESDDNPAFIETEVYFDEVEAAPAHHVERPARKAKAEVKEEVAPAAEAPVATKSKPGRKAKTKTEPVAETPAPVVEAPVEAKKPGRPARKAKTEADPTDTITPTPVTTTAVTAIAPTHEEEEELYGPLDSEDAEVLQLVEDAENVEELAKELIEQGNAIDYQLGGVLYHIRLSKDFQKLDERYAQKGGRGVPSGFMLYLEEQLGIHYRKAMNLIKIYYQFNKFGISGDVVAQIGWTKASKIAPVMTAENAQELVELAEDNTVEDLNAEIKTSYTDVGGEKGVKVKKTKFIFKLYEDAAANVQEILEKVGLQFGLDDMNAIFETIVTQYALESGLLEKPEEQKEEIKTTKARGRKAQHLQAAA